MTAAAAPDVLVLEFAGLPPDAHFDAALTGLPSHRLTRVDPVVAQTADLLSIQAQARAVFDSLPRPPRLILAHCTAATLGLHVAALGAAGPDEPRVALFDPARVWMHDLRTDFANLSRQLSADPEPALARIGATDLDGAGAAAEYCAALAGSSATLVTAYGGDRDAEQLVGQLVSRYCGWLRYLGAAMDSQPVDNWFPVAVVTSDDAERGRLPALLDRPDRVRAREVAVPGGSLLAHHSVLDLVQELVPA
ncbi:hypothetical protein [Jatrophihabitans sp.]|jgi:hypothetical protein|uniref:hypothetical protein n=1 Tax=Jatrophihabitans sp. TaxID=1932789 RepID=UPI002EE91E4F